MVAGIYCITNKINNKKYFGQSTDIERREKEYFNYGDFPNNHLKNAFNKYGGENFEFKIIKCCKERYLDRFEKLYIRINDTMNPDKGYNKEAGGSLNKHPSDETRKKMSESHKGEKNHMWGKKHPIEARKKMSEAHTGKTLSEEHKKKVSENSARYWEGKTLSEEHKKKISDTRTKQYARIIKKGFYNGKQLYGIKFDKKIIKTSISIEKLLDYFLKNYPLEIIKIPKGLI